MIALMDEQFGVVDMGGTMRLGAYLADAHPGLAKWPTCTGPRSSRSAIATATR